MHLHGQPFGGVLENISFTSSFNGKKCKKKIFCEDKWFLSKMFSQIKMQAATNWSSHLKNIKHLILFQTTDTYLTQFSKITFSEIFENHL